mgnify:CR=1 FL=1
MEQSSIARRENPFMTYNHIEIGTVEPDHAQVWLDVRPESANIYGVVHGGALFTMADCCAGLTARTDGREYVTQGASVSFIANTTEGRLTANGKVVSRGRRVCIVDVEVCTEEKKLLFHSTFSMYCVSA